MASDDGKCQRLESENASLKKELLDLKDRLRTMEMSHRATAPASPTPASSVTPLDIEQLTSSSSEFNAEHATGILGRLEAAWVADNGALGAMGGAIEAIGRILREKSGRGVVDAVDVKLLLGCTKVLEAVANGKERNAHRVRVSDSGTTEALVALLDSFAKVDEAKGDEEDLMASSSRLLSYLAEGSGDRCQQRCDRIVEACGVEALLAVMNHSPTFDSPVLAGCTKTLANLTSGEGYATRCNKVVECGGVEAIIKLLKHIPTLDSSVLSGASFTLSNLAAGEDSGPRADKIFELGGVEALVSVAKVTPAEVFPALRSIATTNKYREKVIQSGAGEVAKEFLKSTGGGAIRVKSFKSRKAAHELVLVLIGGSDPSVVESTPVEAFRIFAHIFSECIERAPEDYTFQPNEDAEPQVFIWPPRSLPMMIHNLAAGERGRTLLIQLDIVPSILKLLKMSVSNDKTGRLHITQRWAVGALFNLGFILDDDGTKNVLEKDGLSYPQPAKEKYQEQMKEGGAIEVLQALKSTGVMAKGDEDEQRQLSKDIDFLLSMLDGPKAGASVGAGVAGGENVGKRMFAVLEAATQSHLRRTSERKAGGGVGDGEGIAGATGDGAFATDEKSQPKGHIMLSYNHGSKAIVQEVAEAFEQNGLPIWVDWKDMGKGGSVNTLDQMSQAVENAQAVVVFTSPGYQQSANCKLECEYAWNNNKTMLWVVTHKLATYRASGWLGILQGQALFFNLSDSAAAAIEIPKLITAAREVLGTAVEDEIVVTKTHANPTAPSPVPAPVPASIHPAPMVVSPELQSQVKRAKTELGLVKKEVATLKEELGMARSHLRECEAQLTASLGAVVEARKGGQDTSVAEKLVGVHEDALKRAVGDREIAVREWERGLRECEVATQGVEVAQGECTAQIQHYLKQLGG